LATLVLIAFVKMTVGLRVDDEAINEGLDLTAHGERLLARAESMETDALAIQSDIGGADMVLAGTVRIGAPDGFGTAFLAPRLAKLASAYPGLELQLIAMPLKLRRTYQAWAAQRSDEEVWGKKTPRELARELRAALAEASLDDEALGEALARAHQTRRAHRLIRGNEDEVLHPFLFGDAHRDLRAHDIVLKAGHRIALHQIDVLVGRRVVKKVHSVASAAIWLRATSTDPSHSNQ
jgi:DNA-binding transcriptional LysR family regulator